MFHQHVMFGGLRSQIHDAMVKLSDIFEFVSVMPARLLPGSAERLVEVPALRGGAQAGDPLPADLGHEQRAKALPPEPDGPVAHLDAALVQRPSTFRKESRRRT